MSLLRLSNEILDLITASSATAAAIAGVQAKRDAYYARYDPDFKAPAGPPPSSVGTLCALRLACRRLSAIATPRLFRTITLKPSEPSIARWNAILDDDALASVRALARRAAFESEFERQDERLRDDYEEEEETELTDEWHEAVARLREFGAVDEVYVRFSPACGAEKDDDDYGLFCFEGNDTMDHRREILKAVFDAMAAIKDEDGDSERCIRSLSVENLQNIVDTSVTRRPSFTAVITGLSELHVSVATERNEAAPENELMEPAIPKFWPAFAETWLRPASPSLAALTLYCDMWWGAVPFWHTGARARGSSKGEELSMQERALAFPKLKSLALGNCAFAYDDQLEWLTGGTFAGLQSLMLDDCPIMDVLEALPVRPGVQYDECPPVLRDKLEHVPGGKHAAIYRSRLRWDQMFDGIREGMPGLKTFTYTRGHWKNGEAFSRRDENLSWFLTNRYLGYNDGIGPSQFCVPKLRQPPRGTEKPEGYYPKYDHGGLSEEIEVPSNDPQVNSAELAAFERLNAAIASNQ